MSVKNRIKIICENENISISTFEKSINVANGYVNSITKGVGIDKLELILEKYPKYNPFWILTGKGSMKNTVKTYKENEGIPLILEEAYAGYGGGDVTILEKDILDRYVIPDFIDVDFMIRVRGTSMYPTYSSGDIIACRNIEESRFIQWNKVHVIVTRDQGVLIKRLKPCPTENKCLFVVSDNKDYDPFIIPQEDIMNIAIVVGVVRLE